jgi:hypothetical protein
VGLTLLSGLATGLVNKATRAHRDRTRSRDALFHLKEEVRADGTRRTEVTIRNKEVAEGWVKRSP